MTDRFKLEIKDFPAEFLDRFPDGDYTVGRGADPRGRQAKPNVGVSDATAPVKRKSRGPRRNKKAVRPAAE